MTSVNTHLTADYFKNYLKQRNIQIPANCDIDAIFKKHDKYDYSCNKITNADGTTGDGNISTYESIQVCKDLDESLQTAFLECRSEVKKIQNKELL